MRILFGKTMESRPTILVVDDEPAISRHGFNVVIAEDGRDALLSARELLPGLRAEDSRLHDVLFPKTCCVVILQDLNNPSNLQ